MARTLQVAADSAVLSRDLHQRYQAGAYTYTLSRANGRVALQIAGNEEKRSADLQWAFGSGDVGQSYLWQDADGTVREARFNYFQSLNGFGATPGRLHSAPLTMEMAIGRIVQPFEAKACFACHTTAMSTKGPLEGKNFVAGITCEACHGPGAQHAAATQRENAAAGETQIANPARMTPTQAVDFCGACHSTPWDVRLMGAVGLQTVRFPAYRLEKSRCWGAAGDARITCFACHDPHQPLQRDAAAYDRACLQCHRSDKHAADAQHAASLCPVATSKCTTCHMPKYELPEMHAKFTDHRIQVVRAGVPFTD